MLEALTNLPFPRDASLCTRFATQIVFRRADARRIMVSIIPANNASEEHKKEVAKWFDHDLKDLDVKSFSEIMREVSLFIGMIQSLY